MDSTVSEEEVQKDGVVADNEKSLDIAVAKATVLEFAHLLEKSKNLFNGLK